MRLLMNERPCFLFLVRFSSFFSIPWVHSLISIESTENIFPRSCSKQSMTPLGSRKLQQVWHFLLPTFASVGERIEEKKKRGMAKVMISTRKKTLYFISFLKMFCFFFSLSFFYVDFLIFFFNLFNWCCVNLGLNLLVCFGCLLIEISD